MSPWSCFVSSECVCSVNALLKIEMKTNGQFGIKVLTEGAGGLHCCQADNVFSSRHDSRKTETFQENPVLGHLVQPPSSGPIVSRVPHISQMGAPSVTVNDLKVNEIILPWSHRMIPRAWSLCCEQRGRVCCWKQKQSSRRGGGPPPNLGVFGYETSDKERNLGL